MFVHRKTERPAFLISHDSDVVYSDTADLARPHHTVTSYEFFAAHREATPDELPATRPGRSKQPPGPPAGARKAKGKTRSSPAAKPRATVRPASHNAPAPAASPSPRSTRGEGGEPHGE